MNKEEILSEWQRDHGQDFDNGISERTFSRYLKQIQDFYCCKLIRETNNENRYRLEYDKNGYSLAVNMRLNALFIYSLGINPQKIRQLAEAIQNVAESDQPDVIINKYINKK